ncbi:hypothetical protein LINPERPRIM_LOCUS30314, partial [Linum perenne]
MELHLRRRHHSVWHFLQVSGDDTGSGDYGNPDDYIVKPLDRHGATGGAGRGGHTRYVPPAMYRFGDVATFP